MIPAGHHEPARGDAVRVSQPRSTLHELWLPQRDAILAAWRLYEAGHLRSALVAGPYGPEEVQPVTRHGAWAVHQEVGDGERWCVTLGPIGVLADYRATRDEAEAIAEQLHAATPADFDPTAWVESRPAWMRAAVTGSLVLASRAETARDELRAALRSIASALGMSADALPGAIVERVERIAIEHGDEARDLAALLAAADHVDASARAAEGAGPAEREAAREARHELRRVVAELRAGVPAGVLVSREDAAVVRAVLATAERGHAIAGEGREGDAWDESGLEDAVCDYERAGRPLASKEA